MVIFEKWEIKIWSPFSFLERMVSVMTILDYLKNHTLEEILENHEILFKLDPRDDNFEILLTDDIIKKDFWDPNICEGSGCECYTYEGYDEGMHYCNCDLYDINKKRIHRQEPTIRCPYEKEHINYLKNLVKYQLLTNIGGDQNE